MDQGFDQALGAKLHKASKILWKNLSPWAKNRLEKRWNLGKTRAQNYWSFSSKVNSGRQKSNLRVKPKWIIIFSVKYKSSKKLQRNSICIKDLFNLNQNVTFPFKMNFSLKVKGTFYYFKWKKFGLQNKSKNFVFFFIFPSRWNKSTYYSTDFGLSAQVRRVKQFSQQEAYMAQVGEGWFFPVVDQISEQLWSLLSPVCI